MRTASSLEAHPAMSNVTKTGGFGAFVLTSSFLWDSLTSSVALIDPPHGHWPLVGRDISYQAELV